MLDGARVLSGMCARAQQSRDVRLIAAPGFFGGEVLESRAGRRDVVEGGVLQSVPPVWKLSRRRAPTIERTRSINGRAVHAVGHSVVLRGVGGRCHGLVRNTLVLEKRLDLFQRCIRPLAAVRASKDFEFVTSLEPLPSGEST